MTFNKFMEHCIVKTMWLWLPIHAFFRLSKELRGRKKN